MLKIKRYKKIAGCFVFLILLATVLYWVQSYFTDAQSEHDAFGSMNGIALKIPNTYSEAFMEYEGESVWQPKSVKTKRTYNSKIDSFELSAKWPNFEHKHQNNNLESYKKKDSKTGSKDWLHISIQSLFENKATEQQWKITEEIHKRGLYSHPLFAALNSGLTSKSDVYREGEDNELQLKYVKPTGAHEHETYSDNDIYYWDGIIDLTIPTNPREDNYGKFINEGKLNTVIRCPQGDFQPNIHPKCTQQFLLPEMSATVTLYYYPNLLPHWREMQAKSVTLILGMTEKKIQLEVNN